MVEKKKLEAKLLLGFFLNRIVTDVYL